MLVPYGVVVALVAQPLTELVGEMLLSVVPVLVGLLYLPPLGVLGSSRVRPCL